MTAAQRIAIATDLHTLARGMIESRVRRDHPEWSDAEVMRSMLDEPE